MRTADEILKEIFSQTPLPNVLYTQKARWKRGKLKETAIAHIIRTYSDWEPVIMAEKKKRRKQ